MTKQKFSAIIIALLFAGAAYAGDDDMQTSLQEMKTSGLHVIAYSQDENGDAAISLLQRMQIRTVAKKIAASSEPLVVDITARNASDLARVEGWFQAALNKAAPDHLPVHVTSWIEPTTDVLKVDVRPVAKTNVNQ